MILAGDVGGTKTNIALCTVDSGKIRVVAAQKFSSRDAKSLESMAKTFVAAQGQPIEAACFGIAGPVRDGHCVTTNLPWQVHVETMRAELGVKTIGLLNDLEANAWGISALEPSDFLELNAGAPGAEGHRAVIAAGTGLGEAGMFWDGQEHHPFACEGGHCDFSPRNDLEFDMLKFLQKEFTRVSFERVLSGPGLFNVYRFLRDTGRGEEPGWLADEFRGADPAAVVSKNAASGKSPLCSQALDVFVSLYGAEAGNWALKMMSLGGVFLGGGIAPKIKERLQGPLFMEAFLAKGRLKPLLQSMPVKIILRDTTAVLGAARFATRLLSAKS